MPARLQPDLLPMNIPDTPGAARFAGDPGHGTRRLDAQLVTDAADKADILWFLPTHGDGRYLGTEVAAPSRRAAG